MAIKKTEYTLNVEGKMMLTYDGTANKMLDEFEKQFQLIVSEYYQKNISEARCIQALNWLRTAWNISRVDIKNNGKHNQLESFGCTDEVEIVFPGWFCDEQGQGVQVILRERENKITFRSVNEGNIKFSFRGANYKDFKNNRRPVLLNYITIKLNNSEVIKQNRIAWHDKPIIFTKKCKDNELFVMEVICENIYHYFPSLKAYLLNINKKNLDDTINDVLQYIQNKKQLNSEPIESFESNVQLLNKQYEELFLKLEEQKKETNNILDSYNFLFNTLFKYNKVEPKPLVQLSRELNMQLLDFIENVCKKHNLQWWLYAGTLLGAIRHQGFIPWDDDCDIKMMRDDYDKFYQIIGKEIKVHNLVGFMEANTTTKTIDNVLLPFIKLNYWVDKHLYAFVDIIPSDYVQKEIPNIESVYKVETKRMLGRLRAGEDRKIVLREASERLGVSKAKTNKIMGGIEDAAPSIHDYDTIFPLKTIKFENRTYPCPNHHLKYVAELYGDDYMQIPKEIYAHGFYDYLSKHKNVHEQMEKHINKLDHINKNF